MSKKKLSWMVFLFLIFSSISKPAFAQTLSERTAQAFFFEAEKAMANENYETALKLVGKAQQTLGSNNALLESIRVRALYETGQFESAGAARNTFYELNPSEELSRSLAPIIVKLQDELDAIESRQAKIQEKTKAVSDAIKKAGLCLVDAEVGGLTKTHSREVWTAKETVELVSIPSTFKTAKKEVIVQESAPIGSSFETDDTVVVVQEATTEFEVIPAEYEDTEIKLPLGVGVSGQLIEGEVSRRTYLKKASTRERVIPAVTKTIQVRRVKKKGKSKKMIPAVTKTVTRRVVQSPARVVEKVVPEVIETVEVVERISPPTLEKVNAMCKFKENDLVVKAVKMKLKERGYFSDLSEDVSIEDLNEALIDFQKKNDLPSAAALTQASYKILELSN